MSSRLDRVFRLRRLGVLCSLLALTLAAAPFVERGDDAVPVTAGDVVGTSVAGPVVLSEIIVETTTTALGAGVVVPMAAGSVRVVDAVEDAEPATTSTTVHVHAERSAADDAETEAAAEHVHTAPTTTAAPTTTTTAAPHTHEAEPAAEEAYAYDDPRSTQVWYDLADCEAGGNWAANTGNGYYGGLQFSVGTWERVGGTGYPHHHDAPTQIEMGRRLQAQDGWDAWPSCAERLGLT